MMNTYHEHETQPLYIGYIELPVRNCRLRFEPEPTELPQEKDIPIWAFSLALIVVAVMIGVGAAVMLLPYGGICR